MTVIVLAALFLLFTLFDRAINAWTDWLWFDEVRYRQVFTGVLATRLVLFALFGIGMGVIVALNLYLAYRLRPLLRPHSLEQQTLDRYRLLLAPRIGSWTGGFALLVGLFAGLSAQGRWQQWMLFANAQRFGVSDPQFGQDVGFYVFEYPFWRYLLGAAFAAVVISVLGALAMHYLFGGVRLQGAGDRMTVAARAHLTTLVALFVLLKAVAYYLDRRGLLLGHNDSADVSGAGYTDINALLPAKEILAWISVVVAIAILVFSNAWMRSLLWPGVAMGLLVISAVAIGGVYPYAVQSFTVKPSPLSKEPPYIQRSIDATRQAFGLSDVKVSTYDAANTTPSASLAADKGTVANIRLLDPAVVSDTYTQLQQVRGFYDFGDKLDIDRYPFQGNTQDYVVGVREINYDRLTAQQGNWQNRHTVYTHGYGFVSAPANQLVCGGQPLFVSGFLNDGGQEKKPAGSEACSSPTEQINTSQPRIYYGERMRDYVVVGNVANRDGEFDRPTAGADQYFTYDGKGGVAVGSYWRRVLYAAKYREANFLLSSVFNQNSKLLYERTPRERVEKVAPFLKLDGDPYPAVVNGRIVWILDGYTTSSTYPYSQRVNLRDATSDAQTGSGTFAQAREEINYLRNSVKATVDAYDGTVKLYSYDDTDPVLKAWNQAFGGNLILPRKDIPAELEKHFRYPEDQFKVQRDLLARYHVTAPDQFFSGPNFWQVPDDPSPDTAQRGQKQPPYYLVAQFPGQEQPRYQLTAAMTPRGRPNLAALMSASLVNGKPDIQLLQLPEGTITDGPSQVQQRMTSMPDVTRDLNLFRSQNSKPIYGNLLSLPVDGGMLYVEPLYIRSTNDTSYPLMRKVLVSYGKYVAYEDTLQAGIESLIRQATGQAPQPTPPAGQPPAGQPPTTVTSPPASAALAEAAGKIQQAITDLRAAQQSGDFEKYGQALKALEDAVKAYQALQQHGGGAPAPAGSRPSSPPSAAPSPSASTSP
ncbi:UPF0182 family protein [Planosporangium flavigriseum]|uniref:UPF0182 protein Pfl04_42090 n=1 Tax=Planosporangium flavigriseum TaxID=373681 RepID=A0A8J3LYP0_9ACTN|nr:UPF0182 protein [Planosporangium flavigriseum]